MGHVAERASTLPSEAGRVAGPIPNANVATTFASLAQPSMARGHAARGQSSVGNVGTSSTCLHSHSPEFTKFHIGEGLEGNDILLTHLNDNDDFFWSFVYSESDDEVNNDDEVNENNEDEFIGASHMNANITDVDTNDIRVAYSTSNWSKTHSTYHPEPAIIKIYSVL